MNKWEKAEDSFVDEAHEWAREAAQLNFSARALPPGSALRVCVLEAEGLPHTDWAPFKDIRPDPYVRITVFDEVGEEDDCHSRQIRNNDSPVIDFCCELALPTPVALEVQVFDHDYVTKDQILGKCDLPPSVTGATWCELRSGGGGMRTGGGSGRLKLSVSLRGHAPPWTPPGTGSWPSPAPPPLFPPRSPWVVPVFDSPAAYKSAVCASVVLASICAVCVLWHSCSWRHRRHVKGTSLRDGMRELALRSHKEARRPLGPFRF